MLGNWLVAALKGKAVVKIGTQ